MVLTSAGNSNAGSRIRRDGGVRAKEEEYGCAIHRDATDSGHLQGDVADAGDVSGKKVVGKEGPRPGGRKGGNGSGSGRRRGKGIFGERGGIIAAN